MPGPGRIVPFGGMRMCLAAAAVAVVAWAAPAQATLLTIVDTPHELSGPFLHNVFHSASGNGSGTSGSIKAYYDLDTAATNTYNTATGQLWARFNVFSDSALSMNVGTVTAHGTLPAGNFGGNDGSVIGTLTMTFNLDAGSSLAGHLGSPTASPTLTFLDKAYVTSALGYVANSYVTNASMTLWGADGYTGDGTLNDISFQNATLGTDLVLLFQVPEPATMALFVIGLGLLAAVGGFKRKVRSSG